MAVELRGEDALEYWQHLGLAHRVEAEVAPRRLVGLDHPGGAVGLVLVAVREDDDLGRLAEEILEGVERARRAQPGELVGAQVDARLEVIRIFRANSRIDSVRDDDQIGIGELVQILDLALEAHLHAEIARAVLQDVEQRHARAAAEAVAARAQHLPLVDYVDVAPVSEAPADALVGDRIAGLERIERLVGEHHPEAEGVVGPVALADRDLPARPGFLREEREVQAAGPAADDADFHAAPSGITAVASISRRAASSTRPLTCTTAIVG